MKSRSKINGRMFAGRLCNYEEVLLLYLINPYMKKIVSFSLLMSMFFLNGFGQTKEELVGTWIVTKAIQSPNTPEELKHGFDKVEKLMLNSTMEFAQDGKCRITLLEGLAKEAGGTVGTTTWAFNEIDKSILVHEGSGKNKELLLKIFVKKEGKKYYFIGDELFVRLDVKKNKK
jgi:phosphomevalonate kinase